MITFEIEQIDHAKSPLETTTLNDCIEQLILDKATLKKDQLEEDQLQSICNIVASSHTEQPLVYAGSHSFLKAMHWAYAEHRPFIISPDMIWLLIAQGFSKHIQINAENLKYHFTTSEEKQNLVFETTELDINDPHADWEPVFNGLTNLLRIKIGDELVTTITNNFSTTLSAESIASQITLMDAMKSFYTYEVRLELCGIPELTLEGTKEDWQKLIEKAKRLKKYDLDWWINSLLPPLQEFVNVFDHKINTSFWKAMFKHHTSEEYGEPNTIDGWILKFFPYLKNNERTGNSITDNLSKPDNIPPQFVSTDFICKDVITQTQIPMEASAGFMGIEQNDTTMALRPKIGWFVRQKSPNEALNQLKQLAEKGEVNLIIDKFPEALHQIDELFMLTLNFTGKIEIPRSLKNINVKFLRLTGKTNFLNNYKILSLFPNTDIFINKNVYRLDQEELAYTSPWERLLNGKNYS